MASSSAFHPHGEHASPLLEFVESKVRAFGTTEALRTTEGTDFEISSSVISVVLSISVVFQASISNETAALGCAAAKRCGLKSALHLA